MSVNNTRVLKGVSMRVSAAQDDNAERDDDVRSLRRDPLVLRIKVDSSMELGVFSRLCRFFAPALLNRDQIRL